MEVSVELSVQLSVQLLRPSSRSFSRPSSRPSLQSCVRPCLRPLFRSRATDAKMAWSELDRAGESESTPSYRASAVCSHLSTTRSPAPISCAKRKLPMRSASGGVQSVPKTVLPSAYRTLKFFPLGMHTPAPSPESRSAPKRLDVPPRVDAPRGAGQAQPSEGSHVWADPVSRSGRKRTPPVRMLTLMPSPQELSADEPDIMCSPATWVRAWRRGFFLLHTSGEAAEMKIDAARRLANLDCLPFQSFARRHLISCISWSACWR